MLHILVLAVLLLLTEIGLHPFTIVPLYLIFTQIDHAIFLPIVWYRRFKRTAKSRGAKMEKKDWMFYTFKDSLSGLATTFRISGNKRGKSDMTLEAIIELPESPPDLVVGSEALLGSQERNRGKTESIEVGEDDIDMSLWFSAEQTDRAREYLTRSRMVTLAWLALAYPESKLENQRLSIRVKATYTHSLSARSHKQFFDDITEAASSLAGVAETQRKLPSVKSRQIRQSGFSIVPVAALTWVYGWFFRSSGIEWVADTITAGGVLQIIAVSGFAFWLIALSGTEAARLCLSFYWTLHYYLSLGVLLFGIPAGIDFFLRGLPDKGVWVGSIIVGCAYFFPALYWWLTADRVRGHLKALK